MPANPYVVLTIQLFQTQLLAARAVGDAARAEAFEAAIRSLLEDGASGLAPAVQPLSMAN
ncbi:MAG: hypothetical protein QM820_33835 [Minicystis sp.]